MVDKIHAINVNIFFGKLNFPVTFDFTGKNKNQWFGVWKFPA